MDILESQLAGPFTHAINDDDFDIDRIIDNFSFTPNDLNASQLNFSLMPHDHTTCVSLDFM